MHQISNESRLIMSDELMEKVSHLITPTETKIPGQISVCVGGKVFIGSLEGLSSTRKKVTVDVLLPVQMPPEMSLCIISGHHFDYIEILGQRIEGRRIRNISMRDIEAVEHTNLSISFAKE